MTLSLPGLCPSNSSPTVCDAGGPLNSKVSNPTHNTMITSSSLNRFFFFLQYTELEEKVKASNVSFRFLFSVVLSQLLSFQHTQAAYRWQTKTWWGYCWEWSSNTPIHKAHRINEWLWKWCELHALVFTDTRSHSVDRSNRVQRRAESMQGELKLLYRVIVVQHLIKTLYVVFSLTVIVSHLCVYVCDHNRFSQNLCIASDSSVSYTGELLLAAKQPHKEHFTVKCHAHGHHNTHCWGSYAIKLPCVCVCVRLQKHFSGELVSNSKSSHMKVCYTLRSFPFLRWHMYYNTASSSLWAFTKGFSEVLLTGSEIYCTERCGAKRDSHLKDNRCSKDSLLLRQEPSILRVCQYAFRWMGNSGRSNFQNFLRLK